MKKYKHLILIVSAVILVTAAVLTFIIWQSLKLSNDLKNNPDSHIENQTDDKNYNLEDKDTNWKSDDSSVGGKSNTSSSKNNSSRTTDKKGNGSGNDRTTDKTPATLAPIDQSNGNFDASQTLACQGAGLAQMNAEVNAIDADTTQKRNAVQSEQVRINNLASTDINRYNSELQAFKNAHGGRDFAQEQEEITRQDERAKQAAMNRFSTSNPGC